jgi:hypothetical protein
MAISEKSEKAIKEFLEEWWGDLVWQASQTVMFAELPPMDAEQLYLQPFGDSLRQIAAAAEGLLPDDLRGETHDAVQTLCEWMFARPGMGAEYGIPASWWATPVGSLAIRALVWAEGDRLISMTEAAEISGRSLSSLSQLISRGKLNSYPDPGEPNPTRARRVLESEIRELPAEVRAGRPRK